MLMSVMRCFSDWCVARMWTFNLLEAQYVFVRKISTKSRKHIFLIVLKNLLYLLFNFQGRLLFSLTHCFRCGGSEDPPHSFWH